MTSSGTPELTVEPRPRFTVRLANFSGPFDVLLRLIGKHELDVTEVALHEVTDEFIAHTAALGPEIDLDESTEFLVIAATLLDLKAARLLPSGAADDEEDLALLEARDLLFARLLQYRAYQQAAGLFAVMEAGALCRYPRSVALEEAFAGLLPEVMLGVDPARFADIAAAVFRPRPPSVVPAGHLLAPEVSVREQAALLAERLTRLGAADFAVLVADCGRTSEVVARFLALLDLYGAGAVSLSQTEVLGELLVTWTGSRAGSEKEEG